MTDRMPADVIYMDVFFYWVMTMGVVLGADFFAKRRLGKSSLGYKALKIPRYTSYLIASVATILLVVGILADMSVNQQMLTFFGVPYFVAWVYYLVSVFRRIKAERVRRL